MHRNKFGLRWFGGKRGWLRPLILSLLEKSPKTGIELIDSIEKMSMGWWRPSPGSVYPLLDDLVKEGVIKRKDGGRYELTHEAREEIKDIYWWSNKRSLSVEDMIKEMDGYFSYLEDLSITDNSEISSHKAEFEKIRKKLEKLIGRR